MTIRSAAGPAPSAEPLPPNSPDTSALLGDWLNADRGVVSKGPLRLTVAKSGTGIAVRAIGTGLRQPGDWGEVPAAVYTAPGAPSVAWSYSAAYELGGLRTVLSAYYKTGILVVTASSVPLDGGGRPGEWTRSFFHRIANEQHGRPPTAAHSAPAQGGGGGRLTAPHTDLTRLTGGWVNFDTTATGIRLVDSIEDEGRLSLSIAESGPGVPDFHTALTATPLVDAGGDGPAVGFLAEGRLGVRDAVLCGYLNRGLLTIDVHTIPPDDQRVPPVMYRAHYYRPGLSHYALGAWGDLQPPEPPEGAPLP
jgi:hypothetical protein